MNQFLHLNNMRNHVFCLVCLVGVTMLMGSCKSEQSQGSINDNIQGIFFGVPFGANRKEVVGKFEESGFSLSFSVSTAEMLHFSKGDTNFTFGGMDWENLRVFMSNDQFWGIIFFNTYTDKEEALCAGDSLLSTVSAKYKLDKEEPEDSTVYFFYRGNCLKDPKRQVSVYVKRYWAIRNTNYYGVFLQYADRQYEAAVSDEL